jgi:hypothetical protein
MGESIVRWVHWLKLMLGRTPAADDSDRRFVAVTRGASTALGLAPWRCSPASSSCPLIRFWAGEAAEPPSLLLVWMGIWSLIVAGINPVSCLLNSAGHIKVQAIFASLATALNLGLSVY